MERPSPSSVVVLSEPIRIATVCCGPDRACWRCGCVAALSGPSSKSPLHAAASSSSSSSSSSAAHNPCQCHRCRGLTDSAPLGPLLHPSLGVWSDPSLAARAASLPVCHPTETLDACVEWSFFLELSEDALVEWPRMISRMRQLIDAKDCTKAYFEEAHAMWSDVLNLHLPALEVVTHAQDLLGRRIEAMQNGRWGPVAHLEPKEHAACMPQLHRWQAHLLQLLLPQLERLRSARLLIIELLKQADEMDTEAAEWAHVNWHEQCLAA